MHPYENHPFCASIAASLASPEDPEPVPEPELVLTSCKAIKEKTPESPSGVYTNKNNGTDLDVYCDMVAEGGGWTLIVAQYDSNPVTDWAGGLKADRIIGASPWIYPWGLADGKCSCLFVEG